MQMDTSGAIHRVLSQLGQNGFDETTIPAQSATSAISSILQVTTASAHSITRELKRQKLVEFTRSGGHYGLRLTPAGAHRLQKVSIASLKLEPLQPWDGMWRLVSFDVPLQFSHQRAQFARQLQRLGFVRLQRSLWVIPCPCDEIVEEIASYYNVWRYCTLIEAARLDRATEAKLKRQFFA